MHRPASSAASHLRLSKIAGSKVDSERSGKEQAPDSRTNTIDRPAVDERRERLRPIEFGIAGYGRTRSEASFSASSSPLAQQLQENWVRPTARTCTQGRRRPHPMRAVRLRELAEQGAAGVSPVRTSQCKAVAGFGTRAASWRHD